MSSINHRSSKRRRHKPSHYMSTPTSVAEERQLQRAIANSRLDSHRPSGGWLSVPAGPTFYPTIEEFEGNPLVYINKIRPVAERYGICKIVPPPGWNPPFCVDMDSKKKFETKKQLLHRLQEGIAFDDGDEYTPGEYQKMAAEKSMRWKEANYPLETEDTIGRVGIDREEKTSVLDYGSTEDNIREKMRNRMTAENLERDYWDIVETQSVSVAVEYGNDVDTNSYWSGFPQSQRGRSLSGCESSTDHVDLDFKPKFGTDEFYRESWWNLNNIPRCPGSVLRYVNVGINGINVPWLYFGSLFSTFCWHNEDNYLYSINYHHRGAPKQWYGVPGTKKDSDALERVFKNYLAMKMRDVPDLLHHITTMISPRLLQQGGVPVYKLLQHPGEFMVTFPRSFHGGFSLGPNVGEAVNFATPDWLAHGADANERYRTFARPAVFSHDRLTFTLANHVEDLSLGCCEVLGKELQRVIEEEVRLRARLFEVGVRDVSGQINLPRNRLDQLDEESADYDEKRLCHTCKHVCFFSAVACECSQSRVSCLRHCEMLCRCRNDSKYMMVWCTAQEMRATLENVQRVLSSLRQKATRVDSKPHKVTSGVMMVENRAIAPGALRDWQSHQSDGFELKKVVQ